MTKALSVDLRDRVMRRLWWGFASPSGSAVRGQRVQRHPLVCEGGRRARSERWAGTVAPVASGAMRK